MIKNPFSLFVWLFFASHSLEAKTDTLQPVSEVAEVTVFFAGAQISRTAELTLSKGSHLLSIEPLSPQLDPQTIQVQSLPGLTIVSVKHQVRQPSSRTEAVQALEDSIDAQMDVLQSLQDRRTVLDWEQTVLQDNRVLGKEDAAVQVQTLREVADFYMERIQSNLKERMAIREEINTITDRVKAFQVAINKERAQIKTNQSRVEILVSAERDLRGKLGLQYYVPSAGWEPTYDFRVADVAEPLAIVYNAQVFQSTGEDWNQVKVTLSSSNPVLRGDKPELERWVLGNPVAPARPTYRPSTAYGQQTDGMPGTSELRGRVVDSDGEGVPYANVSVFRQNVLETGAATDLDGNFSLRALSPGMVTIEVFTIGYQRLRITDVALKSGQFTQVNVPLKEEQMLLQEIAIMYEAPLINHDGTNHTISMDRSITTKEDIKSLPTRSVTTLSATQAGVYQSDKVNGLNIKGSRGSETEYYIDGVKVRGPDLGTIAGISSLPSRERISTQLLASELRNNITMLEYVIEAPYTIPSDGKDNLLQIKQETVPVEYLYRAVSKIDLDVFLTAAIPNWQELNLLSGKASIYFMGTFTGESFLDANLTSDTLVVSLGRDRNLVVERKGNKNMIDRRLIGSNYVETIGWDILVKNNRSTPVRILVEDQFPVSTRKTLSVTNGAYDGAVLDEQSGKLLWDLKLQASEAQTLSFDYSVKYPKSVELILD